jgi:YD repeat-containing protein
VDQDDVSSNSLNHRRTEYVYNGLTTQISVCQVWLPITLCSLQGANMDGSPKLEMSRTFDSAGKLISTTDANGQTTKYWFDGAGNPLKITDVMNLSITANYNDFGHRLNVTDPDRGTWSFTYNGFGEVKTQTDARAKQTTLSYDKLGRVISRSWDESSRTNLTAPSFVILTAPLLSYALRANLDQKARALS